MKNEYTLQHGKEVTIPLVQKPGYKIVAVIVKGREDSYILNFIPVYEKDLKTYKNPLTDFNLN